MPPNASTAAGSASRLLYENDDVEHVPRFERQGALVAFVSLLLWLLRLLQGKFIN
jgi:hypothetical protein